MHPDLVLLAVKKEQARVNAILRRLGIEVELISQRIERLEKELPDA